MEDGIHYASFNDVMAANDAEIAERRSREEEEREDVRLAQEANAIAGQLATAISALTNRGIDVILDMSGTDNGCHNAIFKGRYDMAPVMYPGIRCTKTVSVW